jgi:hypothetical protein
VPFFKEVAAAGLTPSDCPVVSFSLAEDELRALPTKDLVGELGCWTYFMSIKRPENKNFLKKLERLAQDRNHPGVVKEKRAVDSPMVLSYDGVISGRGASKRPALSTWTRCAKRWSPGTSALTARRQDHDAEEPSRHQKRVYRRDPGQRPVQDSQDL